MSLPALPSWLALAALHPWQEAVALGAICLMLYGLARAQFSRASEDWANAFFYSPSQKSRHRQRRQRWLDWSRALLTGSILCFVAAAAFYLKGPR